MLLLVDAMTDDATLKGKAIDFVKERITIADVLSTEARWGDSVTRKQVILEFLACCVRHTAQTSNAPCRPVHPFSPP